MLIVLAVCQDKPLKQKRVNKNKKFEKVKDKLQKETSIQPEAEISERNIGKRCAIRLSKKITKNTKT